MSGVRVLFEDDELVAVEKPAGTLVIPARKPEAGATLQQLVEAKLGAKVFVVHRLDRDAGGVVVFGKTAAAHKKLSALFESRAAKKTYRVAVLGRLEGEGRVDAPLRGFGSGRVGVSPEGKPSLTLWRSLSAAETSSLLEVGLITGRRHQIRVHLFSIGHPVLGDALYGEERPVGGAKRLMLHAWKLELPGKPAIVCDPPPELR